MDYLFFGTDHTVTLTQPLRKNCTCQYCGTSFMAEGEVQAVGTSIGVFGLWQEAAKRRGHSKALRQLERKVAHAWPLAPCPRCGRYQAAMLQQFRKTLHHDVFWFAWFVVFFILAMDLALSLSAGLFWFLELLTLGVLLAIWRDRNRQCKLLTAGTLPGKRG
ncbi:hypothetical protein [Rhodoferax aquaticus]|uniref:Uncharacterized protein n=1 Tax=Rhodoferax aquaticus TaxID=2527691 RepID=A0A515EJW1_9BURK|nr:hypothetical protein [Rhodoferax aquaticus]QDL52964.1 hypothetical protein EXZ61_01575 [Rhodoferax aquaticus]